MEDNLTINWSLKKALKEQDMTLKSLESLTGIHKSILSWASTGRINLKPEERRKVAAALGKPETELF